MFKKAISLLLSVMLVAASLSVTVMSVAAADETVYFISGANSDLFGAEWASSSLNASEEAIMTDNGDDTYTATFADVEEGVTLGFKIVEENADGSVRWIGVDGGDDNFQYKTTGETVTVTYDLNTDKTTVTGAEEITGLDIEYICAVGDGADDWLYGASWLTYSEENLMTEISDNVYQISYEAIPYSYDLSPNGYQVKFVANGEDNGWTYQWGVDGNVWTTTADNMADFEDEETSVYEQGTAIDFVMGANPSSLRIWAPYDENDITITLDLNDFDYTAKTGAKVTVEITDSNATEETTDVTEATEETTTEAAEETTTEAAAEETTTEAEATASTLKITSTSNMFDTASVEYNEDTNQFTVSYIVQSAEKDMLNIQWRLYFDTSVLAVASSNKYSTVIPATGGSSTEWSKTYNAEAIGSEVGESEPEEGWDRVKACATNTHLYDITSAPVSICTVTFDIIDPTATETEINFLVDVFGVSLVDDDENTITAEEEYLVNSSNGSFVVYPDIVSANLTTVQTVFDPETNVTEATTTEETTTEVTEETTEVTETPTEETTEATEETTTEVTEGPTEETTEATEETTTEAEPETTEAAAYLTVTGTSNLFASTTQTFDESVEYVTVDFYLGLADSYLLENLQYYVDYDGTVLELVSVSMPQTTTGTMINTSEADKIYGSAFDLGLYEISGDEALVSLTFKVVSGGDTTVNLNVEDLTIAQLNAEGTLDESTQLILFNNSVAADGYEAYITTNSTVINATASSVTTEETTVAEETTEAPTEATTAAEETTEAPTEATTEATEETTEAPATEPVTDATDATDETTAEEETTTTAADTDDTDATTADEETTTTAADTDDTDATSATSAVSSVSTADTATSDTATTTTSGGTSTTSSGAVQTGSASMAAIILLVLVSATGALYFTRKKVK